MNIMNETKKKVRFKIYKFLLKCSINNSICITDNTHSLELQLFFTFSPTLHMTLLNSFIKKHTENLRHVNKSIGKVNSMKE